MDNLEISARTLEEAIQHALAELGVSREEVEVDILKEGKPGFLGLGAEEAKIRVRPIVPMAKKKSDIDEIAKSVLETLLGLMGVTASVVLSTEPLLEGEESTTPPITLNIRGNDLGILIGRRGQNLSCLQYIVRLIITNQGHPWMPIVIDVEGYKRRRYEALRALAWRIAEQVKVKGVPFTLEPMPANERRIIHLTLADYPGITTQSVGEGEARKVVIILNKQ